MSNYHRNCVPGGTYFFAVNLLERRKRRLIEEEAIVLAVGWSGAIKSDADFWMTTNKIKKCRVGRLFCSPFNLEKAVERGIIVQDIGFTVL
ncbi:MAG: hypothetical protein V3U75_06170 [Methylococcaceae bacterium]